jgi:AcrR family transcriptional regulator
MEHKRRTQSERSATTRGALVAAARRLWADRGYAAVGTPEVAAEAGVTRGAMYHQFADKAALFGAVAEAVEADLTRRLARDVAASGPADAAAALHAAADAWLAACEEPEVRQVLLLDGPVVLGWDGLRDITLRHGLGMTEELLRAGMDAGQLASGPTRPLAHVLIGALDEAALYVATAEDRAAARDEVARVLHALLDGLITAG